MTFPLLNFKLRDPSLRSQIKCSGQGPWFGISSIYLGKFKLLQTLTQPQTLALQEHKKATLLMQKQYLEKPKISQVLVPRPGLTQFELDRIKFLEERIDKFSQAIKNDQQELALLKLKLKK